MNIGAAFEEASDSLSFGSGLKSSPATVFSTPRAQPRPVPSPSSSASPPAPPLATIESLFSQVSFGSAPAAPPLFISPLPPAQLPGERHARQKPSQSQQTFSFDATPAATPLFKSPLSPHAATAASGLAQSRPVMPWENLDNILPSSSNVAPSDSAFARDTPQVAPAAAAAEASPVASAAAYNIRTPLHTPIERVVNARELCVTCGAAECAALLLPCADLALCLPCARQALACPVCGSLVASVVPVRFSGLTPPDVPLPTATAAAEKAPAAAAAAAAGEEQENPVDSAAAAFVAAAASPNVSFSGGASSGNVASGGRRRRQPRRRSEHPSQAADTPAANAPKTPAGAPSPLPPISFDFPPGPLLNPLLFSTAAMQPPPLASTPVRGTQSNSAASRGFAAPAQPPAAVAKELYKSGNFAGAVARFDEHLRAAPNDHVSLCNRAAAHMMLLQFDAALDDCEAAVALAPGHAVAQLRLVRLHQLLGDLPRALEAARAAAAAVSENPQGETSKRQLAEATAAEAALTKVLESEAAAARELLAAPPISSSADMSLARNAARAALAQLDAVAASASDAARASISGCLLRARAHMLQGAFDLASDQCRAALPAALHGVSAIADSRPAARLPPALLQLAAVLAAARWAAEDSPAAERILVTLERLAPAGTELIAPLPRLSAISALGMVQTSPASVLRALRALESTRRQAAEALRDGRHADAERLLSAALVAARSAGAPSVIAALYAARAAALAASNQHEAAAADCDSALALAPEHVAARLRRARARAAMGYSACVQDFAACEAAVAAGQPGVMPSGRVRETVAEIASERARAEAANRAKAERSRADKARSGKGGGGGGDGGSGGRRHGGGASGGGGRRGHGSSRTFHESFFGSSHDSDGSDDSDDGGRARGRPSGGGGGGRAPATRAPSPSPHDYYALLGVAMTASADDCKRSYRALALRHHPDKDGDEAHFKLLSNAFSTLSEPASRRAYDEELVQYRRRHPGWRYMLPPGFGAAAGTAPASPTSASR